MQKMSQNKWGRLGRYKNRNWSRKNVLDSWDRALSMGYVKSSVRVQEKCKKCQHIFGFRATILAPCCWRPHFSCFECSDGSEKLKFVPENQFWSKFSSKTFFWRLIIFHSCCKILCFTFFPILLKKINFGTFLLYVISFFSLFDLFFVKNPPPN